MSYYNNNNRGGYGGGYGNRGGRRNNYYGGRRNNGGYNSYGGGRGGNYHRDEQFKRSGCTLQKNGFHSRRDNAHIDLPVMHGWNAARGWNFIASPHRDEKKRQTANERWENWMVKITERNGKSFWVLGHFDTTKERLHMGEIGMIANPNTPMGYTRSGKKVSGYWGKIYKN